MTKTTLQGKKRTGVNPNDAGFGEVKMTTSN